MTFLNMGTSFIYYGHLKDSNGYLFYKDLKVYIKNIHIYSFQKSNLSQYLYVKFKILFSVTI